MKQTVFNMPSGPIEICSVFDFVPKVKLNFLPSHYEQVALDLKQSYSDQYMLSRGANTAEARVQSKHKLVANPMKLLTELKKTLSPLFISRQISLDELLYNASNRVAREMGAPTHFFSIGEDVYALVSAEDCVLFQTESFKQQLVCVRPERNLIIYCKKLEIK